MESENFSEIEIIEAKASFIANYRGVLEYTTRLSEINQLNEFQAILHQFYSDWKVIRNINVQNQDTFFSTLRSKQFNEAKNVDELVQELHKTHSYNKMVSLCGKTAFILHPDKFLPFDRLAFKSLKSIYNLKDRDFQIKVEKENYISYEKFMQQIQVFKDDFKEIINYIAKESLQDAKTIENKFSNFELNFESIRINRITDKLLWIKGKE